MFQLIERVVCFFKGHGDLRMIQGTFGKVIYNCRSCGKWWSE